MMGCENFADEQSAPPVRIAILLSVLSTYLVISLLGYQLILSQVTLLANYYLVYVLCCLSTMLSKYYVSAFAVLF